MAKAAAELYDVLVVGAGPAGGVAALRSAQLGASTLLIEKQNNAGSQPCGGWTGPAGVALCEACGLSAAKVGAKAFRGLRLHSWDLKKNTLVEGADLAGWVVERPKLDQALCDAAKAAGAAVALGRAVAKLTLGEDRVTVTMDDGNTAAGRLLLIADGLVSATARMANLVPAAAAGGLAHCQFFRGVCAKPADARLDVAIGAGRTVQLATVVHSGSQVRTTLVSRSEESAALAAFQAFRASAAAGGLTPADMQALPSPRVPAGTALDMETHVGKRCLLLGDAGGFVASFSAEGIYPAMRSGWIAAEVARRAVQARVPQDELATFDEAWRSSLADYLRMPNTDLSLLMPLVFNNAQMSRRVAGAFLLGQPF